MQVRRALRLALPLLVLTVAASVRAESFSAAQVEWIDIPAGGTTIRAAVARPAGGARAPLIVVLHGSGGFRPSLVALAETFARAGFVAVAGCWFTGAAPGSPPAPDIIPCPGGPPFAGATTTSIAAVKTLVAAGRELPGVRSERVGLFGHSRGATAALLVASTGGDVQAVVASSPSGPGAPGGPDTVPLTLAERLGAPVLLLHGTADETVPVSLTRKYEQALRALGKPVEAHYYEGAGHELPFNAATAPDVVRRAMAFFDQHLGAGGPAADTTAPAISLRIAPGQGLNTVGATGLRVSVRCSEACSIQLLLSLGGGRVGAGAARLAAAGTVVVVVELAGTGRKKLSRMASATLTLSVRATDDVGNLAVTKRTLALRR